MLKLCRKNSCAIQIFQSFKDQNCVKTYAMCYIKNQIKLMKFVFIICALFYVKKIICAIQNF